MEKVLELIKLKKENLESRSRRNNVCLVDVPEMTHMGKMEDYVEELIKKIFLFAVFTNSLSVERAHRIPAMEPSATSLPHGRIRGEHIPGLSKPGTETEEHFHPGKKSAPAAGS